MTTHTLSIEDRFKTISDIWRSNQGLYVIVGIAIGLLLYPALSLIITNLLDFFQSLVPEIIGIGFTVLFIDRLNQHREQQRRIDDLQDELIRETGSPIAPTAVHAIHILRKHGWLGRYSKGDTKAVLRASDLSYSSLDEASLNYTDLHETKFNIASLNGAFLKQSNLSSADLSEASMIGALMTGVDLSKAHLKNANLTSAMLHDANLQSADLQNANLTDTFFNSSVQFNTATILPDGTFWSQDRNLAEFGAETRLVINQVRERDIDGKMITLFTFEGGMQRRWKRGKGWLD